MRVQFLAILARIRAKSDIIAPDWHSGRTGTHLHRKYIEIPELTQLPKKTLLQIIIQNKRLWGVARFASASTGGVVRLRERSVARWEIKDGRSARGQSFWGGIMRR